MRFTLLLLATLFSLHASAQKKEKKQKDDHRNFYKETIQETEEYKLEVVDALAEKEFSKLKLVITNKTDDYLFFDASKCVFVFDFGEVQPKEKPMIIEPGDSKSRVLNVKDDVRYHVENYTLKVDGFEKASAEGKVISAEDFRLPPAMNDFKAGPFDVTLLKLKKETDNTVAQFQATYNGNEVGLVDPAKVGIRIEEGQEFANAKPNYKLQLLEKGDKDKFNAHFQISAKVTDMQFATMWILWRNMFRESKKIDVDGISIDMKLDIGKTAAMN